MSNPASPITITIGHDELIIRRRYEALSIVNDILIAIWFTIGSVLFFDDATTYIGTWFFLIGSIELVIRPAIRLTRQIHLRRMPGSSGTAREADHDF